MKRVTQAPDCTDLAGIAPLLFGWEIKKLEKLRMKKGKRGIEICWKIPFNWNSELVEEGGNVGIDVASKEAKSA